MGEITKREDEWLRRGTAVAITEARKVALDNMPNMLIGHLNDSQWGWLISAAIFGWIETRVAQAIEEGLDQEQAVLLTGLSPSPSDVAVVHAVLPELHDKAAIDWSQPLTTWSRDTMTGFLMTAWRLINQAEYARDHGTGKVLQNSEERDGDIPFVQQGSS